MKCFKMFGLLFASLAMLAMVGCGGGGGGGSHNTNQNTTVAVLVPLPTGGSASMRTSMRAVAADKFKAYYLNSAGEKVPATSISGLDTANATVAFADVPPGNDLVITTELDNGNGFKSYYKGLVKKADLAGGQLSKKINAETTAKAMLFEAKKKTTSTLSVADFEYTLKQEENKGNDIWTILGVTSTAMEKSLKDLTVEKDVATAVETAANSLVITPEPDDNVGVDELLAASWKDTTESEVSELVSYYKDKAAKIIYSYDGGKWVNPTDDTYMVYFKPITTIHLYHFYTEGKTIDSEVDIHIHNNIWDIYNLNLSKTKKIQMGSFKLKKATIGRKVYLKLEDTESNNSSDSIFMEQVNIPTKLKAIIDELAEDSV